MVPTFLGLGAVFVVVGCASGSRYVPGMAVLESGSVFHALPPESISAVLKMTFTEKRRRSTVTVVVSALPYNRYKLDFKGPVGSHLASFYWVRDSNWTLYIPSEDFLSTGGGEWVNFPFLPLDSIPIHSSLAYLWGDILTDSAYKFLDSGSGWRRYRGYPGGRVFQIESSTGTVRRLYLGKGLVQEFGKYHEQAGRQVPERMRFWMRGRILLEVTLKSLDSNPKWNKSPFFINVPSAMHDS